MAHNYEIRAALIVRTITASQRHCLRCRVPYSRRLTFAEKQSHVQYDNRNLTLCICECEHCTFSSSDSANAASTQLVRMYRSVEWRTSAAVGLSRAAPAIRGFEGASESGATMISGPGLSPVSSWRRPESVWRRRLSYHSPPHNHTLAHSDPSLLSVTEPYETQNDTKFRWNKKNRVRVSTLARLEQHWFERWMHRLNVCWAAIMIRPLMLPFWDTTTTEDWRGSPNRLACGPHTWYTHPARTERGEARQNKSIEWSFRCHRLHMIYYTLSKACTINLMQHQVLTARKGTKILYIWNAEKKNNNIVKLLGIRRISFSLMTTLDREMLVGRQGWFKALFARTHKSYYIPTITTKRGRLLAKHSLCIQIIKADQTFGRTISFCLQSFLSKKSGERAPGRAVRRAQAGLWCYRHKAPPAVI